MHGLLSHRTLLLFHRRSVRQTNYILRDFRRNSGSKSTGSWQTSKVVSNDFANHNGNCNKLNSFSSSSARRNGGEVGGSLSDDNSVKPSGNESKDKCGPSSSSSWLDKVVYSSYLEKFAPPKGFRERLKTNFDLREKEKDEMVLKTAISPPVALRYLMDSEEDGGGHSSGRQAETFLEREKEPEVIQFPYKISKKTEFIEDEVVDADFRRQEEAGEMSQQDKDTLTPGRIVSVAERLRKLEIDPESVLEEQSSVSDIFDAASEVVAVDAGTPDPKIPPSNIPCGGCGALLHCQDKSIPGYISSEKFKKARKADLMADVCHRCSVLETHQVTLNVNVSTEDYPRIVSKIREKFAMVLLLVDLTDFPCSIWPGILDIIGNRRPIILVGNKVDLLPQDSPGYLKCVEESLVKCTVELGMLEANIIHTALVSAKTGYGVENLISAIFNLGRGKGDIFIMGCTNVGKSSLFNSFLQSDLCKPQASDLVQKATISQWPGTTLNLLKFPMTIPSGMKKYLRIQRLNAEKPLLEAEERERKLQLQMTGDPEHAVLMGHVGQTFISTQKNDAANSTVTVKDLFIVNPHSKMQPESRRRGQWNPEHSDFTMSHWVYDTPGAVNSNQILDLLTLPELTQSLPNVLIQPRSFYVKPQMSFFIGGLARVDFVEGPYPIRLTVFSNSSLPVTMSCIEDADEVYKNGLGTKVFGVPSGGPARISQFPPLESKLYELEGSGHTYSCADIVLSSIGWVAVTAGPNQKFSLSVYTPSGKGIFLRQPALLPQAVNYKGKRVRGTFAYLPHKVYVAPKRSRKEKYLKRSISY